MQRRQFNKDVEQDAIYWEVVTLLSNFTILFLCIHSLAHNSLKSLDVTLFKDHSFFDSNAMFFTLASLRVAKAYVWVAVACGWCAGSNIHWLIKCFLDPHCTHFHLALCSARISGIIQLAWVFLAEISIRSGYVPVAVKTVDEMRVIYDDMLVVYPA